MQSLFTIGIPSRNRPEMLREAISSALTQQKIKDFEVVVVDDASDMVEYQSLPDTFQDSRLRWFRHSKCEGEAGARNTIIKEMKGDYVFWLDDDDCLLPDGLASQVECLKKHPDASVIYSNLLRTDREFKVEREYRYRAIADNAVLFTLVFYSPFPNGGSMISRELFQKAGMYNCDVRVGTDYDFWVRAALAGAKFVHNDNFTYLYRAHENNAALDKENESYCFYNSQIFTKLLGWAALSDIFTPFPWEENPLFAQGLSEFAAAIMYYRYRCYHDSRRWLQRAGEHKISGAVDIIEKLITLRESGDINQAVALEHRLCQGGTIVSQIMQMAGLGSKE